MVKFVKLCSGGVVLVFVFASIFFFFWLLECLYSPKQWFCYGFWDKYSTTHEFCTMLSCHLHEKVTVNPLFVRAQDVDFSWVLRWGLEWSRSVSQLREELRSCRTTRHFKISNSRKQWQVSQLVGQSPGASHLREAEILVGLCSRDGAVAGGPWGVGAWDAAWAGQGEGEKCSAALSSSLPIPLPMAKPRWKPAPSTTW